MSEIKIITNNQPRPLIYWHELTETERSEFNWVDESDPPSFFKYKGNVYAMSEFLVFKDREGPFKMWDGHHGETAFSGVLVRLTDDSDYIVVGRFYQ